MDYKDLTRKLGSIYFRKKEDSNEFETIRFVGLKNEKEITVLEDGVEKKVSPSFLDDYRELVSDGIITFSIVQVKTVDGNNVDDVIVCVHRRTELELGDAEPYIVCRQNINDFFYNYINQNDRTEFFGVSVSRSSCPENIDFMAVRACDDISYSIGINFYIEDSIDTILKMIKTKKFDKVLESGLSDFMRSLGKIYTGSIKSLRGRANSLELLLKENNLQYDINTAFNITEIGIDMEEVIIDAEDKVGKYRSLNNVAISTLNELFKINISNTIVQEYDHSISLDEILGKHMLIRDSKNVLYIISYTVAGEYRETDLEVLAVKEMMDRMISPILRGKRK